MFINRTHRSASANVKEKKSNGLKELHVSMRVKSTFRIKECPGLTSKESSPPAASCFSKSGKHAKELR